MYSVLKLSAVIAASMLVGACGGGGGDDGTVALPDVKQPTYTVGGSVSGLGNETITLSVTEDVRNTVQSATVIGTGSSVVAFTFTEGLVTQTGYTVRVTNAPSNLGCSIANGQSRIASTAVTNVQVNCELNTYTVGGTVTGLVGSGLQLQNNGADTLNVSAVSNTPPVPFGFLTAVSGSTPYAVTVLRQPVSPSQTCSVTSGGSGPGTGNNVSNVVINCITNSFVVGGMISGLAGTGLQLQLNGGNTISVTPGSTSFAFTATPLLSGTTYSVTVVGPTTSPVQNCLVAPGTGSGPVGSGPISSVLINCSTNTYTVGGNVTGLGSSNPGLQLALSRNGSPFDTRNITGDGGFAFNQALTDGNTYLVSIASPHPHFACTLGNTSGEIDGTSVGTVSVSCLTPIQVSVSGLGASNAGLVLYNYYGANNGNTSRTIETRSIPGDGTFQFPTTLPSGRVYTIGIDTEHPDYACSIANGDSSIQSAAVNVAVTCTQRLYRIGGNVTGLGSTSTGLRLRREAVNGYAAEEITLGTANPQAFEFVTRLPTNSVVTLTEIGEPDDRVCTFSNATNSLQRTISRADINDIAMNCATPAPLTVLSTTPTNNATNVALSAPITITFSHPINPDTVNNSTVTLTTPQGNHSATLSVSNNVVTVGPSSRLVPLGTYTLTISSTVRGAQKESLATGASRTFSAASGWAAAGNLGLGTGYNQIPWGTNLGAPAKAHVAGNGNAVIVWEALAGYVQPTCAPGDICFPSPHLRLASRSFNAATQTWSAVQYLTNDEYGGGGFLIDGDANGNALLIWSNGGNVVEQRFTVASHTWSTAQSLGLSSLYLYGTSFSMNSNGDGWLAVAQIEGEVSNLYLRRFVPAVGDWLSGTWGDVSSLTSSNFINPQISISDNGIAHLAWSDGVSPTRTLYVSQNSTASMAGWTTAIPIVTETTDTLLSVIRIVSDATGNAILVWQQQNDTTGNLYARRFRTSTGWEATTQNLGSARPYFSYFVVPHRPEGPQIAMNATGNAVVAWPSSAGVRMRMLIGDSWSSERLLGDASSLHYASFLDAEGNASVLWSQNGRVRTTRYSSIFGAWSADHELESETGDPMFLSSFVGSDGNAFAFWSKNQTLYGTRFGW